jgi:hypothetical protein
MDRDGWRPRKRSIEEVCREANSAIQVNDAARVFRGMSFRRAKTVPEKGSINGASEKPNTNNEFSGKNVNPWRDRACENKMAAKSVGRSRRQHWQTFSGLVALRSRLLRQRSGVPHSHLAADVAGQHVAVGAKGDAIVIPGSLEREKFLAGLCIPHL